MKRLKCMETIRRPDPIGVNNASQSHSSGLLSLTFSQGPHHPLSAFRASDVSPSGVGWTTDGQHCYWRSTSGLSCPLETRSCPSAACPLHRILDRPPNQPGYRDIKRYIGYIGICSVLLPQTAARCRRQRRAVKRAVTLIWGAVQQTTPSAV